MKKIIVSRIILCLSLIAYSLLSIQGSCRKEGLESIAVAVIEPTGTLYISGKLIFNRTKNNLVSLYLELRIPSRKNSSVVVHIHEHGMCGNTGGDDSHNILGRSIIAHSGIDNYTQPTGNSGQRIRCGVIERKYG